jgi:hypothetical protein
MVQPGRGGFNQINREELDDKKIIVRSAHPAREVVILQPDAGVGFAIVLGDVA